MRADREVKRPTLVASEPLSRGQFDRGPGSWGNPFGQDPKEMRGWAAHTWLPKGGFQENLCQAEMGGPGRQGLVTGILLFSGRGSLPEGDKQREPIFPEKGGGLKDKTHSCLGITKALR